MPQVLVRTIPGLVCQQCSSPRINSSVNTISFDAADFLDGRELYARVSEVTGIPTGSFSLEDSLGVRLGKNVQSRTVDESDRSYVDESMMDDLIILVMKLQICGGIDFQHREGSKIGSGGQMSESQAALERKERLRKLALETIDISKDPYIIRNNLGTFECKLCLTVHPNEGNYLAHTQGKRHQYNLGRRAAMEAKNNAATGNRISAATAAAREAAKKQNIIKIGRPGYKVTKSRDLSTRQRALTFELEYPEAAEDSQPRHRFMSAYEQKVETPDKSYQYVLFACAPYETVAFKIPNAPIDRAEGRFFTNWDAASRRFVLQLFFVESAAGAAVPSTTGSAMDVETA